MTICNSCVKNSCVRNEDCEIKVELKKFRDDLWSEHEIAVDIPVRLCKYFELDGCDLNDDC